MRTLRWFAGGVLTLVVLQVLSTGQGPARGGEALRWADSALRRLMSPEVGGLPRVGGDPLAKEQQQNGGGDAGSGSGSTPAGQLPRNPVVTV